MCNAINVIIYRNPYFSSSATSNRWLTLIEGLANLGVNIKLFIYGGFRSELEQKQFNENIIRKGISCQYIFPKLIQGYFNIRYHKYIGSLLHDKKLIRLIVSEISKQDGLIWTEASYFGFQLAVQLKKRFPERKLFLEMSEFLDIFKYNKGNFFQSLQGINRHNFFDKKAFYAFDGIALMTKTLYRHYEQFPNPKPHLLHLPMTVDFERFSIKHEPLSGFEKPYFAFVGVMNDAKDGVNILIRAFAKISIQYPNHKLYLIGAWNYDTPGHLKMIKELGLGDRIFWMKEYPRERIPAIIKNADILVLPRPNSKQAQGGFPTKLGEYLATGNPVCATSVGEIPDYLVNGESIFFAEPDSVDSFANAMLHALSNPERAKVIGLKGKNIAKKCFNKDVQSKILFDFLSENLSTNN